MDTVSSDSSGSTPRAVPHPCRVCGTKTSVCCEKCKSSLSEVGKSIFRAYYCSSKCQDKDWVSHEERCQQAQSRMLLFRASELIHRLFVATRRPILEVPIKQVDEQRDSNGRFVVWKGHIRGHESGFPINEKVFPSEDIKRLFFTWSAGELSTVRFYMLLEACIYGFPPAVDEVITIS